jgi:hypothetical protein
MGFSLITFIFAGYFGLDFYLQNETLNYLKISIDHLRYISLRPSNLRYSILFTLEEVIMEGPIYDSNNRNMREFYNDAVYQYERDLFANY